jgi:uncharacterized membrane protein
MTNELKAILFLHILAAMVMAAGILGVLLLYLRARSADDPADAYATVRNARALLQRLFLPGAGLAGVIGFFLMLRYDAKEIFDAGKQGWVHTSIVLWLIANIGGGILGRQLQRATDSSGSSPRGDLSALKASLNSGTMLGTAIGTGLLTLIILYLMVFQPFVSE